MDNQTQVKPIPVRDRLKKYRAVLDNLSFYQKEGSWRK
jgi:hypothetical protein